MSIGQPADTTIVVTADEFMEFMKSEMGKILKKTNLVRYGREIQEAGLDNVDYLEKQRPDILYAWMPKFMAMPHKCQLVEALTGYKVERCNMWNEPIWAKHSEKPRETPSSKNHSRSVIRTKFAKRQRKAS